MNDVSFADRPEVTAAENVSEYFTVFGRVDPHVGLTRTRRSLTLGIDARFGCVKVKLERNGDRGCIENGSRFAFSASEDRAFYQDHAVRCSVRIVDRDRRALDGTRVATAVDVALDPAAFYAYGRGIVDVTDISAAVDVARDGARRK